MATRKLTNSMRSCWNSCHRKYKFSYIDLYKRNRTSDALLFGTAFHSMMEVYWGLMLKGNGCEETIINIAEDYAVQNDDAFGGKTLLALFNGYVNKYLDSDKETFVCVSVEAEYDTPLINPENENGVSKTFHLAGKLDGIIADRRSGEVCILEHKTTSMDIDPASDYWMKLPIDGQVSGYYLGAKSIGYTASKCLYDVIRKPTIKLSKSIPLLDEDGFKIVLDADGNRVMNKDGKKPRQTADAALGYVLQVREETPSEWYDRLSADIAANSDKYYQRMELARSETDLEDYLFDMWSLSQELISAERTGRFSRNPNGCSQYGTCEFFDVCTGSASLEDEILFTRKEKANEEL